MLREYRDCKCVTKVRVIIPSLPNQEAQLPVATTVPYEYEYKVLYD